MGFRLRESQSKSPEDNVKFLFANIYETHLAPLREQSPAQLVPVTLDNCSGSLAI